MIRGHRSLPLCSSHSLCAAINYTTNFIHTERKCNGFSNLFIYYCQGDQFTTVGHNRNIKKVISEVCPPLLTLISGLKFVFSICKVNKRIHFHIQFQHRCHLFIPLLYQSCRHPHTKQNCACSVNGNSYYYWYLFKCIYLTSSLPNFLLYSLLNSTSAI